MTKSTLTIIAVCLFGLSSCLKDPGSPKLEVDKSSPTVGETVNLTLSAIDNYTCILWSKTSGIDYQIVSGGGDQDLTMGIKFDTTGICNFSIGIKNCKGDDDPCSGNCADKYVETTITVN